MQLMSLEGSDDTGLVLSRDEFFVLAVLLGQTSITFKNLPCFKSLRSSMNGSADKVFCEMWTAGFIGERLRQLL